MADSTDLPGFQRTYLRSLAHPLKPVVMVGKEGVTEAVIARVRAELDLHELIKVRLQQPQDKKAMASALASATDAVLCGLVGHTVILYRRNLDEPRIRLPEREG